MRQVRVSASFLVDPLLVSVHYLAIGHLAKDLTPTGPRLGGTVAYAALTARALGYPVGIATAYEASLDVSALADIHLTHTPSAASTTFENIYSPEGRTQFLRARAEPLTALAMPIGWRQAALLHFAPLAQEIDPSWVASWSALASAFVGLTPQGWLREWDGEGRVSKCDWPDALATLPQVNATVISLEDIRGEWAVAEQWAKAARVLVVTEGAQGCTVFVQGQETRQFAAPPQIEVDPTGAGDVFAAAFFINHYETDDPWASARFANQVAALSITRVGLDGIPTPEEVSLCRIRAK